ncbi:hypothetical protein [Streptomyces anthocyanicus]|uniref:hypothetical protein n=1 Tax=Streptomyces anthocyanicus TaxID=68174 RepID=UPI0038125CA8
MTPTEEIEDAARKLSSGMLGTGPNLDIPLAKLLREAAALHTPNECDKHVNCGPFGCEWCGDEDWPCADIRNALAVARAVVRSINTVAS